MPAPFFYRSTAVVTLAALMAAGISGCRNDSASTLAATDATLPLAVGEAQSVALAPAPEALPPAPVVRYVPVAQADRSYQYIDDAYEVNDAFGDAPPDYSFDYGGARPWVWQAADAWRVVEPAPDGERYYYYRAGSDEPYLVRDASYSYAYSEGRLVNVYDSRGYALDRIAAERRADWAGRYLVRARALRAAAARDHREQVIAANWAQRQARIEHDRAQWARDQEQTGAWRAYHARYGADQARRLAPEKQRRHQDALAYQTWRDHGYAGAPPQVVARQAPQHNWQFWKQKQEARQVAQTDQDRTRARQQQIRDQQARQQQVRQQQARQEQARQDQVRQNQMRQAHDNRVHDNQVRAQAQAQARAQAQATAQAHPQSRADARHDAQIRQTQQNKAQAAARADQKRRTDIAQAQKAQAAQLQSRSDHRAAAKAHAKPAVKVKPQAKAKPKPQVQARAQVGADARHKAHNRRHDDNRRAPSLAGN